MNIAETLMFGLLSIKAKIMGPQSFFKALNCIFFSICCSIAYPQFFYMGAGGGIINYRFSSTVDLITWERVEQKEMDHRMKSTQINLMALYRPSRKVGLGLKVSIPRQQTSRIFMMPEREPISRYSPQINEYELIPGPAVALSGRFYMFSELNVYAGFSTSIFTITEIFQYERPALPPYFHGSELLHPAVEAVNIEDERSYFSLTPGIEVGFMPHIERHLFVDLSVGFDIFRQPESDMVYSVEAGQTSENTPRIQEMRSPLQGLTGVMISYSIAIGYFF